MSSKFFIVGTPIGNLKDITIRAINTLKNVDYIACEDTRVTAKLLNHYKISSKLISYNVFNEKNSAKGILKLLKEGKKVALVSDAGMPLINDPGFEILKLLKKEKINFELIPGVSALSSTFSLTNFSTTFSFMGFFPPTETKMKNLLLNIKEGTYLFFISPHKLIKSLEVILNIFKGKEEIFLVKELTKINETHYEGNAKKILDLIGLNIKGEFSLVLHIKKTKKEKVNKYPSKKLEII